MLYEKDSKLILLFSVLLILFIIIPPCITAARNDTNLDSQNSIALSDTGHEAENEIEASVKTGSNIESSGKSYPDFEDNDDYYFDINSLDDYGDGTKNNPYKTLKDGRIFNYTNIHLANGEYNYTQLYSHKNIAIYGEDCEKTIINGNGGVLIVDKTFVLRDISIFNLTIINYGTFKAYNTIFSSSSTTVDNYCYGSVFSKYSTNELYFDNCTFKNSHADYGGAIYMNGGSLDIISSKFINNTASIFGGAILSLKSTIKISYTDLINNSAKYAGGAIYQIYNKLSIDNSNLSNNSAKNGGAIYSSLNENIDISNNKFKNNYADNYGGALYLDEYTLKITNNEFNNNHANIDAGAIYSISNSSIQNTIKDNNYINNTGTLHNDSYENPPIIFISNGNYTLYHVNITSDGVIPSKYDLRDHGYVSPVKDQANGGNCWAFYSISALESAILKASNIKLIELSQENMKNLMALYSPYGWFMETNNGGYDDMSIGYFTSWLGPIYESNDIYDDSSKLSPVIDSITHVQNIIFLKREDYTDNNAIKEAILKYGGVSTSMYYTSSYERNNAYYYNGETPSNHGVLIVGWDDNYSKYNFRNTAPGDGAWIAKNSWGTNWGDNGYFYVSYYDSKFAEINKNDVSFAFILNDTIKYDKNYQYDIPGKTDYFLNSSKTVWYKNIFNSTDEEYLVAVSTYFEKDTDWELNIQVRNISFIQTGHSSAGYYTINLNELIKLYPGDLFEVTFKITVDENAGVPISEIISLNKYFYKENISFISYDGENWADLYQLVWTFPQHSYNSQVACIKAFTILNPINTSINLDIINRDTNNVNLTATVYNQYGFLVDSGNITFNIGDDFEIDVPVFNGIANLNYTFTKNVNTTITATFKKTGYTTSTISKLISNYLINTKINLTLFSDNNHNPINITAHVTDLKDNPVISGFVIFEAGGRNYTAKVVDGFANLTNISGSIGENNIIAYYTDKLFYYNQSYNSTRINIGIINTKLKLEINLCNPYEIIANISDLEDNPVISGFVEFNINGELKNVTVVNGIANIKYLFKNSGEQIITANYADYRNIYGLSNSRKNVTISKIKLYQNDINLTIKHDTLDENRIIISLNIPKCLEEYRVNFEINTQNYLLSSKNKYVVLDLKDLDDGIYICRLNLISQIYELVDDFSREFTVKAIKTKLIATNSIFYKNGEYSVKLKDIYDNAVVNREVFLSINDRTYKSRTDTNGIAVFAVNQDINNYPVEIYFIGDDKYIKSKINVELIFKSSIILPTNSEYVENSKYEFTILNKEGNPITNQDIIITINETNYYLKTDLNGKASLTLSLTEGNYEIIITNPITGEKVSQKIRVNSKSDTSNKKDTPKILKNKNISTYYKSGAKYTVRVYINGKAVGAGELVKFKINKKYYYIKTNKNGYASLKITQKPGKYKIYATYNGYTVYNKITVKSTIITKNISIKRSKIIKFTAKLVNSKGKILKNKKISFKIKGKTYKTKTNKKGIAKIYIRLKLKIGKYTITSKYGKLKISNIIKIKK